MAKQTFTTGQVLTAAQMTSLQQTAMLGGAASAKVASYTLVAADAGTAISMSNASATTITVNTGLFSAGDTVFIQNIGAGACTVTAGTATVATAGSLILPQNDAGILYFTATGTATFYDFIQVGAASPLTTKGDLYTFSTSDARLAVGTNGTTLVADSSEATGLKWATASSGGITLISETVASAVTAIDLTSIPGTYKQLFVEWSGWKNSTAVDTGWVWRFNNDSSALYATMAARSSDSAISTNRDLADNSNVLFRASLAATDLQQMGAGWLLIDNYSSTTKFKKYESNFGYYNGSANQVNVLNGTYKSLTAITQLNIARNVGTATLSNDTSTSIRLYGIS